MSIKIKRKRKPQEQAGFETQLSAIQLTLLGVEQERQGNSQEAERTWREAVRLDPKHSAAWTCLLTLYKRDKRFDEAAECLDRIIEISEHSVSDLFAHATTYSELRKYEKARTLVEQILCTLPELEIRAHLALARLDFATERWESALTNADEILKRKPDYLHALGLRHSIFYSTYHVPEAVAGIRRCLDLEPDAETYNKLLFKLNYLNETTPESLYAESRRWNAMYAAPLASEIRPHHNRPDPERRLRIGYVSPDLWQHPVMKLLPAVFDHYDERSFDMFVYSVGKEEDAVTDVVKRRVKNYITLPPKREKIAKRVREDQIDILVDLGGHTMHADAYLAFALKPAPIQVTWLGALATTGMDTIDYFIGDQRMPCPGTEHLFTEKVYRLPRLPCCYRPVADIPIAASPYFKNGYITFGCFNDPRKITREVVHLWSAIMLMFPDSRMIVKYQYLEQPFVYSRIEKLFASYGVTSDRLSFEGRSAPREYLESWNKVDIALDPFPYNGGTTSMDALWMGVPIVTMRGRLAVACSGDALLGSLGFPVANTREEYVVLAGALVKKIAETPQIRQRIRQAVESSPLLDEPGLMRALETAYREMWRAWCVTQNSSPALELEPQLSSPVR